MPQLDALRFLAVLGVLVAHNWHPRRLPWLLGDLDWGGLGVRLFFVLSGFLITGILVDCRSMADQGLGSSRFYVRRFYARRFLRIFPLYYFVIAVALVVDFPPTRDVWVWLVTYTTNIYVTVIQAWPGRLGHFWTLAVEEQFYLVWPWLILYAPRKWLVPIMLFAIAQAPVYRLWAYTRFPFDIGAMDFKAGTLTLASLDALGVGSLIALLWRSLQKEVLQWWLAKVVLPVGVVVYVIALALYHYRIKPSVFFVACDLGVALIFAWLVSSAARGFGGVIGRALEFGPLVYLGKITYGIYVYHYFVPPLLRFMLDRVGVAYSYPNFSSFVLSSLVTLAIASVSWHAFELPINKLKNRFKYRPQAEIDATVRANIVLPRVSERAT